MKDFEKLVRDAVEQGGGLWCGQWRDDRGGKAGVPSEYDLTDYDWILDDEHLVTVTVGYTPDEMAACPKNNYSGLPVDWMHVVEYRVLTRHGLKLVAHEIVKQ